MKPEKLMVRVLTFCALGVVLTPISGAQHFEVASIRQSAADSAKDSNVPLDRSDARPMTNGGLFRATGQPLIAFVIFAYKVEVSEFLGGLLDELPDWAKRDRFDIVARYDPAKGSKEELRSMMRLLLENRFALRVHRDRIRASVLGLHLGRRKELGPQLIQHNDAIGCPNPSPIAEQPRDIPVFQLVGVWPRVCGEAQEYRLTKYTNRDGGRAMTMPAIADFLTGVIDNGSAVQDRTGLPGTYDFALEYTPDYAADLPQDRDHLENLNQSARNAIDTQLGLKIIKEPGEVLVFRIDSVSHPTDN